MKYYTYMYLRYYGEPYYVGKGSNYRFLSKARGVRLPKDRDRILIEYHETEQQAFEAERFLISFYGRKDLGMGCLLNRTDGGEGVSGNRRSEASRRKMQRIMKGRPRPNWAGGKHKEETKRKISESQIGEKNHQWGKKASIETRAKMSASHSGTKNHFYGKKHTPEALEKICIARRARCVSS